MNKFFKSFVGMVMLLSALPVSARAILSRPSDYIQVLDTEKERPSVMYKVEGITLAANGSALIFKGKRISLAVAFPNIESARTLKTQLEQTKSYGLAVQRGDLQTLPGETTLGLARISADRILVIQVGKKNWCQRVLGRLGL